MNEDSDRTPQDYADSDNQTWELSTCEVCGGLLVTRSFMVADGEDDVAWDFEDWCENCDANAYFEKFNNLIDTNTEYGLVSPEEVTGSRIL
jgi:hypothetical protein